MLFYCKKTHEFWKSIQRWISNILNINITLSVVDVLFGIPVRPETSYHSINLIIFHAKYYLHLCKIEGSDIFMFTFLSYLKCHIKTECYIEAIKNSNITNIWQTLLALVAIGVAAMLSQNLILKYGK